MINIGIIGNGFVGDAIYDTLKDKDFINCAVHDVNPSKSMNSFGGG